jgi:membrane protein required for colicin V production
MPIIDIIIAVAVILSVIVGFARGFVKEALAIATLLFAIWSALYFGPAAGRLSESWLQGQELQTWFGRILVFFVVIIVGGLFQWFVAKAVKLSPLGGIDRLAGSLFGLLRGLLLAAIFILAGEFMGYDNEDWWQESTLIPQLQVLADWIEEMAPAGYDLIVPDEPADSMPIDLPEFGAANSRATIRSEPCAA